MSYKKKADILLEVKDLNVSFLLQQGELRAVNGVSYTVRKGEILGLVGESGSGKSVEAFSILKLLGPTAKINSGSAVFEGRNIMAMSRKELEGFRGNEISMIFQNPASYLDPVFTMEQQMVETIRAHDKTISKSEARAQSITMLREVRIQDPDQVIRQYPFELSGGMLQRVMIAIALLCKPKLLIADEPTTALDVTIQSQIIQLLKGVQHKTGMSMIYITHNFGIVAELCDRVSIMCGGYILEHGPTEDIFYNAVHPYTQILHKTIPRMDSLAKKPFLHIEGAPLDPFNLPEGCVFCTRCPSRMAVCSQCQPPEISITPDHSARCWLLYGGTEEMGRIMETIDQETGDKVSNG